MLKKLFKLLNNFNFKYKSNNLMITIYDIVIEGLNIDNYDTLYIMDLFDKKIIKQIIGRFIKNTDFLIK